MKDHMKMNDTEEGGITNNDDISDGIVHHNILKKGNQQFKISKQEDYIVNPIIEKNKLNQVAIKDYNEHGVKAKKNQLKVQDAFKTSNQSSSSCSITCSLWPYKSCRVSKLLCLHFI